MMRLVIPPEDGGRRLDVILSEKTGLSRSRIKKMIETGDVLVDGRPAKAGEKSKAGWLLEFRMPEAPEERLVPEPLPIRIAHKDNYLVVVDKPAGMVVYPAAGHARGTLMNAIAYLSENLASIGAPLRAGVVHRLDKDTSGLMVVALDDRAYYGLLEQFRARSIKRKYCALISGEPKEDEGVITLKIGRSEADRKKMSVRARRGREALTKWRVLERFQKKAALIEATLGTGRTHQIRVHLASLGHPVLGDRTYGRKTIIEIGKKEIHVPRQMLHARVLGFVHPTTGEEMVFESELPEDMEEVLRELRGGDKKHPV
jgi:23S rRNA pseudouridine1911/1915/1917 synthase